MGGHEDFEIPNCLIFQYGLSVIRRPARVTTLTFYLVGEGAEFHRRAY